MEHGLKRENIISSAFRLELHDGIDSTNARAKALGAAGERGVCVLADRQTGGRGRMGRNFFSPSGCGLYMSLLFAPALRGEDSALITTYAAVAVAETLEHLTGKPTAIKWVNDIWIGNRKVCGILTEGAIDFSTGDFRYAVLGIGINVRKTSFPAELAEIASDIETETGVQLEREVLANALLTRLADMEAEIARGDFLQKYCARCFVLGKTVEVRRGNERFLAKALDINDRGELLVETGGKTLVLQSGEVSVKVDVR